MTSYPLEPEPFGMMRMGVDAVSFVSETLGQLADAPASQFIGDPTVFRLSPEEEGHDFADALRVFAAAASDGIETRARATSATSPPAGSTPRRWPTCSAAG